MKFRPRIPPRAGALKEYREQDPKWLDTVYEVESFRGGHPIGRRQRQMCIRDSRALGLHKAEPMAEFTKWLGKSKQLPLGLYEIFPEFFDIKEETTKEKQGEGSAITLKQERPTTIGEKVANWDGISKGEAKVVEEKKIDFS